MPFGEIIIDWYHTHKRDLPWRSTRDPYKIWLSEIILQQTRVDQGMSYYYRFVKEYPTVKKLAAATEHDVLKLWQGLGYYSRARNLHHAAKDVMKRFNGKFPSRYEEILSLKGVGEYTAAAIASFSFNGKYAVVDGNVYRVLARYLGISISVNLSSARQVFTEAALELMGELPSNDFNQAIMEFGALQCKPQNPLCNQCPLQNSCFAFSHNKVNVLPLKEKKSAPRARYFNYLVIRNGRHLYMRRRTGNDVWKNLYDFPLIETSKKISEKKLVQHGEWKKYFDNKKYNLASSSALIRHQLTHQTIFTRFFVIDTAEEIKIDGTRRINRSGIQKLAVPRIIEKFLETSGHL
jgi:A/G-specific adenine glycosylase